MKILNSSTIETNNEDDFLYQYLTRLLEQIRLVQGGSCTDATIRRHKEIRQYLISKQIEKIRHIEETYFNEDGTVNQLAVQKYHMKQKSTLQN